MKGIQNKLHPTWVLIAIIPMVIMAIWFTSAGYVWPWPETSSYYQALSDSFRQGRADLIIEPPPALQALPNPYSETARQGIPILWDASYFNGRYYLYWGPVPAAIIAGAGSLCQWEIGDNLVGFVAITLSLLFSLLIVSWLQKRYHPSLPFWMMACTTILLAVGGAYPWFLVRIKIYEASIASGQAFFLAGLYFALPLMESAERPRGRLFLIGWLWCTAIASRWNLGLAIAFLCFLILVRGFRGNGVKNIFPAAISLLLPFLVGGSMLAAYNAARFGDPLETGIRYQLTDWDYTRRLGEMTSIQNILPNLYNYFFRPAQLSQSFPYLFPLNGKTTWGELNAVAPSLYYGDRVVGLLFSSPIFLLAILSAGGILWGRIRRPRRRKVEGTEASFTPQSESDRMAAALFGATVLLFVPLLLYFYCSERFLMDATPLLSITAAIVMWKVYLLVENNPLERTFLFLMMLCLLVVSAVVNTLLGFSGHDLHFRELNPALFEQLSRWIAF